VSQPDATLILMRDGAQHQAQHDMRSATTDATDHDCESAASEVTLSAVRAVREALHGIVRDFDPRSCDGALAKRFVEEFAKIRRLAEAGSTLALGQVERTDAWAHGGSDSRSTATWFANATGLPLGEAIRTTDTARRLDDLPTTEAAMRDGRLSAAQAATITDAAEAAPAAEAELVAAAGSSSFGQLRDKARRVKAAAADPATLTARQQQLRGARRSTDDDGMRNYAIKLTPGQAAKFEPVWDRFINQVFVQARADGVRDTAEQYAADALVAMAAAVLSDTKLAGGGGGGMHGLVLVDATALKRGRPIPGETCEVAGIGPIDVATAKELLGDAVVDILVKDGVDVRTVAHVGRAANRRQKAALLADWECEVRGCGARRGLEVDHIEPWARTHRTAIEDLGPKCGFHHDLKTHRGWVDGPRGDDGKRTLIPPAQAP
jgi:hypothetical protein